MRKIYMYENGGVCRVSEFFSKADKKIQGKLRFLIEYIKDEKNAFSEPYIKHFSIERYRQLYEFRIKSNKMVRVIFYEHGGEIVLLHAFFKRDRKDTEKALEHSLKILGGILDGDEIPAEYKRELVLKND